MTFRERVAKWQHDYRDWRHPIKKRGRPRLVALFSTGATAERHYCDDAELAVAWEQSNLADSGRRTREMDLP